MHACKLRRAASVRSNELLRLKRRNSASCWNFSDPPTHTIDTVDASEKLVLSGETHYLLETLGLS